MEAQARDLRRVIKRAQEDHQQVSAPSTALPSSAALSSVMAMEEVSMTVGAAGEVVEEDYPWRKYLGGDEERTDSPTGTWRSSEA